MSWTLDYMVSRILNLAMTVIGFFIGARIILKFFQANSATPFVSWIYGVSDMFIAPFRGIFPMLDSRVAGIDWSAIVALIMYAILFYVVASLFDALVVRRSYYHDRVL
jgi:uncharacterized protein YggT (Ycf19 family)